MLQFVLNNSSGHEFQWPPTRPSRRAALQFPASAFSDEPFLDLPLADATISGRQHGGMPIFQPADLPSGRRTNYLFVRRLTTQLLREVNSIPGLGELDGELLATGDAELGIDALETTLDGANGQA